MKLAEAKDVLDEKGLVVRIARLVERVRAGGIKAVGCKIEGAVTIQRRITVIDCCAKGERAAF